MENIIIERQLYLMKRSIQLVKKKPCKTLKGSLTRAFILCGYVIELEELERMKKLNQIDLSKFAKGGIVCGNSNNSEEIVLNNYDRFFTRSKI